MLDFLSSRARSFRYAFAGWWYVIRSQRNAWIHALVSVVIIFLGFWLQIDRIDWALIVTMMALVWAAELFNTALEAVVDLATQEQHPLAKVGKDVGAAAVLIAASAAVIVGFLVLGQPLWQKLAPIFGW